MLQPQVGMRQLCLKFLPIMLSSNSL